MNVWIEIVRRLSRRTEISTASVRLFPSSLDLFGCHAQLSPTSASIQAFDSGSIIQTPSWRCCRAFVRQRPQSLDLVCDDSRLE
jgi:hypothetical protein